jgi:hypothetical protein
MQLTPQDDAGSASQSVDVGAEVDIIVPEAQASIDRAMLAYKAAESSPIPSGDCASPELEKVLAAFQPVEREADTSVEAALASADAKERQAALSLADSLHGLAVDGYLSVAAKYSAAGCQDRARWIYSEIKRVYTGDMFVAARSEADQRLLGLQASAPIPAGNAATPVPIPAAESWVGDPSYRRAQLLHGPNDFNYGTIIGHLHGF